MPYGCAMTASVMCAADRRDAFSSVMGDGRGGGRTAPSTLTVTNPDDGSPWAAKTFVFRVVRKGERYGTERALRHDEPEPLVEVFDAKCAGRDGFDELGQFTGGRYYLSTLLGASPHEPLALDMGIAQWTVSAPAMKAVHAWLASL